MDFNRFTEKSQEALRAAQSKAVRYSHQQVDLEHFMAALLEQEGGLASAILAKAGMPVENLKQRLDQELDRLPKVSGPAGAPEQIYVTGPLNKLMTKAEDEAARLKDEFISVEHFLLSATEDGGATGRLFKEFGITRERLMQKLPDGRGSHRVTSPN